MCDSSTQPSVLHRLLLVVCCHSSAVYCVMTVPTVWLVASPCHLMFIEYIPINVQCRLQFSCCRVRCNTSCKHTFRISYINLKRCNKSGSWCSSSRSHFPYIKNTSIIQINIFPCTNIKLSPNTQKEMLSVLNIVSAFANESKSKLHQSFLLPCKMLLTMFLHCHCKNKYIYVNTDFSPI